MLVLKPLPTRPASVAFSPDGTRLVCGLLDGTARVWDVLSGVAIATVQPPPDEPTVFNRIVWRIVGALVGATPAVGARTAGAVVARFDPAGRWVVLADGRGGVGVVDPVSGAGRPLVRRWSLWLNRGVAAAPDGRLLVADLAGGVAAFDPETWAALPAACRGDGLTVRDGIAVEPGGPRVATSDGDVFDLRTGRSAGRWLPPGAAAAPSGLDWCAGRPLLAVAGFSPTVRVFDPLAVVEVARLQPSRKHTNAAVFTADGRRLLTAGTEGLVRVYDADSWGEPRAFAWNLGPIHSLAVSPDGTRAAAGTGTGRRGRVVVWDLD